MISSAANVVRDVRWGAREESQVQTATSESEKSRPGLSEMTPIQLMQSDRTQRVRDRRNVFGSAEGGVPASVTHQPAVVTGSIRVQTLQRPDDEVAREGRRPGLPRLVSRGVRPAGPVGGFARRSPEVDGPATSSAPLARGRSRRAEPRPRRRSSDHAALRLLLAGTKVLDGTVRRPRR